MFPASWRASDAGLLDHIVSQGNGDASERLHTLGELIHDLDPFATVLVEQEVQLVERCSAGAGSYVLSDKFFQ